MQHRSVEKSVSGKYSLIVKFVFKTGSKTRLQTTVYNFNADNLQPLDIMRYQILHINKKVGFNSLGPSDAYMRQ